MSAFPKSLHCTDEAQQAETVLSAVFSIYIYIYNTKTEEIDREFLVIVNQTKVHLVEI